ncbi:sensor histidine kinase [Zhongshania arctica]|uniref:histidine kinase n=1 Tax=Zhongshania arctica TaxID=3238302 RepID=A0ABV3TY56_9GAMM
MTSSAKGLEGGDTEQLNYNQAILNILEDFSDEKNLLETTQQAILNILDDVGLEKGMYADTQKAVINILDDFADEKNQLESTQRAVLNILDDFEIEKRKVESTNRELSRQIEEREQAELTVREKTLANLELEEALEQLQHAQAELVRSEKMAALGGMVAGISHEINTPVGIGVTAASTLDSATNKLDTDYQAGELTEVELKRFIDIARRSTSLILNNLDRAANLIRSFKQVAVDESSGERRRFEVRSYFHDVIVSLQPLLKNTRHTIELSGDEVLFIDSYPGAFAQIITNLVSNSVVHAFDAGQLGHMRIDLSANDDRIVLVYSDDGCGIKAADIGKIFEPFYTTRRGSGGSGLGLHVVFNLVTQALRGKIFVTSQPGQGAEFRIELPADLMAQ